MSKRPTTREINEMWVRTWRTLRKQEAEAQEARFMRNHSRFMFVLRISVGLTLLVLAYELVRTGVVAP